MWRIERLCAIAGVCGILAIVPIHGVSALDPNGPCRYVTAGGEVRQVGSIHQVPAQRRMTATCSSDIGADQLAAPQEIDLGAAERRDEVLTDLGAIRVRWPRKVELLFGRTPLRAAREAASAAVRALSKAGVDYAELFEGLSWEVVFMDADLPERQIPRYLIDRCHPAWMTPPANLYVVADRAAEGCGGGSVAQSEADGRLVQILLHEIGHVVEFQLIPRGFASDRERAEGFASWFEQYASEFAPVVPRGAARAMYREAARESFADSPKSTLRFSGSFHDYARAASYFSTLEQKRGAKAVFDLYRGEALSDGSFREAIARTLAITPPDLEHTVSNGLKR